MVVAKSLMIQGAGSNVGKSIIVAGLARALVRRGLRVRPFKPQNMSNNAAIAEGGEIGRAQALQALAAGVTPSVDMNPVLLKPETDTGAQIIVQGQRFATQKARDYGKMKSQLMPKVLESFHRLSAEADIILVEGAGSPAEINLRAGDIANMGFAQAADIPVVLLGDIDRGGVIAQLVGTHAVLSPEDAAQITGFGVNKFRGDTSLFDEGVTEIAARTGWRSVGVIPWFQDAWRLPAEDIMDITSRPGRSIKIAVPRLPRIANFDDLDPLAAEPEVEVAIIDVGTPLPGDADLVLIPGSKSTIADLAAFRAAGWDIDLTAHIRRGGHVMGICGGYQMLGHSIADLDGIEGPATTVPGLGHLDVTTVMRPKKTLGERQAKTTDGIAIEGYEIHLGATTGPDCARGWIVMDGAPHETRHETPHGATHRGTQGAQSRNGRVMGAYLHGIFASDRFRQSYLERLGVRIPLRDHAAEVEATLDALADHLEKFMDIDAMLAMARAPKPLP